MDKKIEVYTSIQGRLNKQQDEAVEAAKRVGVEIGEGHNDDFDAFRHAYTSAKVTIFGGKPITKVAGDIVERRHPDPVESPADQYNNAIGREIGAIAVEKFQDPDKQKIFIEQAVKQSMDNGVLIRRVDANDPAVLKEIDLKTAVLKKTGGTFNPKSAFDPITGDGLFDDKVRQHMKEMGRIPDADTFKKQQETFDKRFPEIKEKNKNTSTPSTPNKSQSNLMPAEKNLPTSRFVGVWDEVGGQYKPHPKAGDTSPLTIEETNHRNDLFALTLGLLNHRYPAEDANNEFDQGFKPNGKIAKPFSFTTKQDGTPDAMFLLPEAKGTTPLDSALDFMQALSGQKRLTISTPSYRQRPASQNLSAPDPGLRRDDSIKFNPYAYDNPPIAQEDATTLYDNLYGQQTDPALRDVMLDKQHPLYGRTMKNRQRLAKLAFDKSALPRPQVTQRGLNNPPPSVPGFNLL